MIFGLCWMLNIDIPHDICCDAWREVFGSLLEANIHQLSLQLDPMNPLLQECCFTTCQPSIIETVQTTIDNLSSLPKAGPCTPDTRKFLSRTKPIVLQARTYLLNAQTALTFLQQARSSVLRQYIASQQSIQPTQLAEAARSRSTIESLPLMIKANCLQAFEASLGKASRELARNMVRQQNLSRRIIILSSVAETWGATCERLQRLDGLMNAALGDVRTWLDGLEETAHLQETLRRKVVEDIRDL